MRPLKAAMAALIAAGTLIATPGLAQTFAPPPPPYGPPIGPAPGPRYVLQPGYYRWDGVRYIWIRPQWVARPPQYTRWVPGHWRVGAYGRWHWVSGHWV